jgi:hypothetical protein
MGISIQDQTTEVMIRDRHLQRQRSSCCLPCHTALPGQELFTETSSIKRKYGEVEEEIKSKDSEKRQCSVEREVVFGFRLTVIDATTANNLYESSSHHKSQKKQQEKEEEMRNRCERE